MFCSFLGLVYLMTKSDTVYEYKKIKPIELYNEAGSYLSQGDVDRLLKNKINELLIEQNQMAKDFELYKKAYKRLRIDTDILESQIIDLENRVK